MQIVFKIMNIPTANIVIRFYGSWTGGLAGDTIYLDDFSIIKL